jgi:predicted dehydrogenase
MEEFKPPGLDWIAPTVVRDEMELLKRVDEIDLLVIASPNHLHTDQILRWGVHDITILVEKPVAVSREQHLRLQEFQNSGSCRARIWVAMEYRFIPAVSKLLTLLPTIGDVKMVTIRENRYPFLHKIGGWNRDRRKTGERRQLTLVVEPRDG